jgi:hypothetical protein
MPGEGELREANLNGVFLLPRLHRAESDLVTTYLMQTHARETHDRSSGIVRFASRQGREGPVNTRPVG